jgi:hypothetical protein
MTAGIVRLADDEYVEWSSVRDAPATYILTRAQAQARWSAERMERVEAKGHSWIDMPPMTPERIVCVNRAGPDEETLTLDAIRRRYRNPEASRAPLTPGDVAPCEDCGTTHHSWGECPTAALDVTP